MTVVPIMLNTHHDDHVRSYQARPSLTLSLDTLSLDTLSLNYGHRGISTVHMGLHVLGHWFSFNKLEFTSVYSYGSVY